jgi:hypothetical protein
MFLCIGWEFLSSWGRFYMHPISPLKSTVLERIMMIDKAIIASISIKDNRIFNLKPGETYAAFGNKSIKCEYCKRIHEKDECPGCGAVRTELF